MSILFIFLSNSLKKKETKKPLMLGRELTPFFLFIKKEIHYRYGYYYLRSVIAN